MHQIHGLHRRSRRGPVISRHRGTGQESLDVRLFDRQDIPWDEIAFPVVRDALRRYVEDVTSGIFRLYVADLPHRLF